MEDDNWASRNVQISLLQDGILKLSFWNPNDSYSGCVIISKAFTGVYQMLFQHMWKKNERCYFFFHAVPWAYKSQTGTFNFFFGLREASGKKVISAVREGPGGFWQWERSCSNPIQHTITAKLATHFALKKGGFWRESRCKCRICMMCGDSKDRKMLSICQDSKDSACDTKEVGLLPLKPSMGDPRPPSRPPQIWGRFDTVCFTDLSRPIRRLILCRLKVD